MGEDEAAKGQIGLKPLRSEDDQISIALDDLLPQLAARLIN
jgi:hypothetical protein